MIIIISFVAGLTLLAGLYLIKNRERYTLSEYREIAKTHSFIQLQQGITHYQLIGPESGQVVLLIHGGTIPLFDFDLQISALANAGFRVLRYDHYSRGYSEYIKADYTRDLYVHQLKELLDVLEITSPVHIIGHCFGSAIGVRFAARFPQRVQKIVLLAPMIHSIQSQVAFTLAKLPILLDHLCIRFIIVPLAIKRAAVLFSSVKEKREEFLSQFKRMTETKGFERSLLSLLKQDTMQNYTEDYKKIADSHTCMIIWGNKDTNISREMIDAIEKIMPQIPLYEFDSIGHSPNLEQANRFNRLAVDFLTDKKE